MVLGGGSLDVTEMFLLWFSKFPKISRVNADNKVSGFSWISDTLEQILNPFYSLHILGLGGPCEE